MINRTKYFLALFILLSGCISQFIPEVPENRSVLVVEGLITDQPEIYTVKLSLSMPVGKQYQVNPVEDAEVIISDDAGNSYTLNDGGNGTYYSNAGVFTGVVGRKYKLTVHTYSEETKFYSYESVPMEMKPVPQIDSIFYEKISESGTPGIPWSSKDACQIYIATHDETGDCDNYRWDFTETWEFHLPYEVEYKTCWISERSKVINVKSTAVLSENRISKFPLTYINNVTDRLSVKYSILVNQYSVTPDEYIYWEKLKNMTQNVGGLYDIIPASLTGNIYCIDDPAEKVLGYFSVSAKTSKRKFIKDRFFGQRNFYLGCANDTIYDPAPVPGLGISAWVIEDWSFPRRSPGYKVITYSRRCADCTIRGSSIKPVFWED